MFCRIRYKLLLVVGLAGPDRGAPDRKDHTRAMARVSGGGLDHQVPLRRRQRRYNRLLKRTVRVGGV